MELSDKVKIALIVASPIAFFSVIFGLAIVYRRYHPKTRPTPHAEWGRLAAPQTLRRQSRCDHCAHGQHPATSSISTAVATAGASSSSLQHPSFTPEDTIQRPSTVQPHFAEKTTTVRRLSQTPGEPDKIQRVNSIASTLHQEADEESDTLPFGGRRSSAGSLRYSSLRATDTGEVAMGERRPSILTEPMGGVLDIRRVSVGGVEDLVRVRSASQGSLEVERSKISVNVPTTGEQELMQSPPLSPSHPFSPALPRQDSNVHLTFPVPFRLGFPPKPISTNKKAIRPDSITIMKQRTPSAISPKTASQEPPTCISTIALKSPYEGFSPDSDQGTAKILEAWRGFPSDDVAPNVPHEHRGSQDEPRSPKSAIPDPPSIPLPTSPSPLPTFEDFSHSGVNLAVPVIALESDNDALRSPGESSVSTAVHPPSTLLPASMTNSAAGSHDLSLGNDNRRPSTLLIPLASPSPGTAPKASPSKITYLADVVRENEERRKTELYRASSTVGISSLEGRAR